MKRFSKPAAALFVITALIAVGSLMPQPGNAASSMTTQPVLVTNSSTQPVPVNGTVTGSVGASQAGTWNVGINGTPTVNVGSMPALNGTVNIGNTPSVNIAGTVGPLPASLATHFGQPEANLVTLQPGDIAGGTTQIIHSDGSMGDWAGPINQVLVITGYSFSGNTSSANQYCLVTLYNLGFDQNGLLRGSIIADLGAMSDGSKVVVASGQLPGIVLGTGRLLAAAGEVCASRLRIYGYLAPQ